jgi:hypothetical protein
MFQHAVGNLTYVVANDEVGRIRKEAFVDEFKLLLMHIREGTKLYNERKFSEDTFLRNFGSQTDHTALYPIR